MNIQRRNLDEVSFIRPFLIVLLVLYHALAPWCSAWRPFQGYADIKAYWWIGRMAKSFILPMFVFISSYVWAFQREELGRKDSFWKLSTRKFKRLMIPSLIFSIAYFLILANPADVGKPLMTTVVGIIGGYAHMWFLPMLFLCFIECWLLLQVKSRIIRWVLVILAFCLSIVNIPLEISASFYYLLFFYLGYEMWSRREAAVYSTSLVKVLLSWCLFLITFVALAKFEGVLSTHMAPLHGLQKAACLLASKLLAILPAILGIHAMYSSAVLYTSNHRLNPFVIKIGEYCFGVYIFQQFVLSFMYYKTTMPAIVGNVALPWVGFFVALLLSLGISYLIRLSKVGRSII